VVSIVETITVHSYQTGETIREASAKEIPVLRDAYEQEGYDPGTGAFSDPFTGTSIYLDGIEHDGTRYVW